MKRFLTALIIILLIPSICFAEENNDYQEYIDSFDLSVFETLDDETKAFLDDLEISDFNYESITNISIKDVVAHIINIVTQKVESPIRGGIIVIVFIILSSLFSSMNTELNKSEFSSFFSTVSSLVISILLVTMLTDCIGLCYSTIKLCSNFAYAFFPVFCIIVSTSGGAMSSFSVNSTLLILSQGLNYISEFIFVPITNCFLALGICSSIRNELNLSGIIKMLKNAITTLISSMSAIFVSILSVKTAVSSRADALGLRSVRFAINSVVPVIGSSISEGLLSIQSYSSLIKSGVGVVGIIAVISIFLPALIEVTLWRLMISLSSMVCELFNDNCAKKAVETFKDTLLIIDVILILTMVTTIISIGILVAAKTISN